jgi:hypothetical protein
MVQQHQQLQAAMVQQHQRQAGLTQAPALQQGTAQRRQGMALLPAVLQAATGSSSSRRHLSRRRTRLLLLLCLLLVLAGTAQLLAMAAARVTVKQGIAATDSNSSRRSRPSRCTIPSALHLPRRLVGWIEKPKIGKKVLQFLTISHFVVCVVDVLGMLQADVQRCASLHCTGVHLWPCKHACFVAKSTAYGVHMHVALGMA